LNTTVIEAAQRYPNVRVHFNHKCTDVDLAEAACHLETETGNLTVRGDAVVGVDGAFSAVRASMQRKIDNFQYDESYLAHGYKELTIPPGPDGSWRIEKNALHIWPRKSFMMIALPNPDGSFTCTLFWEFEGPRSFATTKTDNEVRRFFDEELPDAVHLMPTRSPIWRSAISLRCGTKLRRERFARKRNSITCSRRRCLVSICRFIRWSPSLVSLTHKRRGELACKTEFFTPLSSPLS